MVGCGRRSNGKMGEGCQGKNEGDVIFFVGVERGDTAGGVGGILCCISSSKKNYLFMLPEIVKNRFDLK